MTQNRVSKIWSYFSVEREVDVKAQCNQCTAKITEKQSIDQWKKLQQKSGTGQILGAILPNPVSGRKLLYVHP